jgi:hydroxyethylthiazole kinase
VIPKINQGGDDMNVMANTAVEIMGKVRNSRPLIHHITNFVVMNATANITLCAGALPVMAHAKEEVAEMVSAADALVLNLGTLWPDQVEAMLLAGHHANERGIPIVLDPVGAGATRFRTDSARLLLNELSISIVRGNAAEVAILAGGQAEIRGVESALVTDDAGNVALQLTARYGCVAAVTGPIDVVSSGARLARVANGHPMMRMVTGTGCMATSVIAAYAAVESDYVNAAAAALAVYGLAGEMAADRAQGPGTFQTYLYDALAGMTDDALREGARGEVQGR